MKGQMFIVTMIFLLGLVFMVQQLLLGYSSLDMPSNFRGNDYYLVNNVKGILEQSLSSSVTCAEAEEKIDEVVVFLSRHVTGGYSVDISFNSTPKVECANWNNEPPNPAPVNAEIRILSEKSELREKFAIYNM